MQTPALDDTIIAVSSGWRAAPLGIIRLSGSTAFELLTGVGVTVPAARSSANAGWCEASLGCGDDIELPATVFWFRSPHSYTGQDVVEIHTVGSLPALRALASRLIELGARRALPGEFTARAFLNGKLTAGQVDGVLALINAEDEQAARQAARLSRESQRDRIDRLSDRLTDLIALVEAGIDFVEEEDVRFITSPELCHSIDELLAETSTIIASNRSLERNGKPHVALAGLPNAGKSTLFNALLGYERAIVTPILGTTRDVLSAELEVGGVLFVLQDCAGFGTATDELESAAHLAAERAADQADLMLWVHECGTAWQSRETEVCGRIPEDRRILVVSKLDRRADRWRPPPTVTFAASVNLSAVSGEGMPELRRVLTERLEALQVGQGTGLMGERVGTVMLGLRGAREVVAASGRAIEMPEIVAAELRRAWEAFESASRSPLVENVLKRIFERFCIGK
jgi:tRNA modification GTPase